MSKVSVFDSGWIDLVFEGRNQKYGAYQLRQQDSKTTLIALFSGIALIGALVAVPVVVNYLTPVPAPVAENPVLPPPVIFDTYPPEKPIEIPQPEPLPQEPAASAPKNPAPSVAFTPLTPTSGPIEKDPPTTNVVLTTDAGPVDDPGTGENTIVIGPTSPDGKPGSTGTSGTGTEDKSPLILTALDVKPEFPGGMDKFYKYIGNNFRSPEINNAATMKVYVSFVIEKDGSMTNILVPRDPGYGMANEAIRVLKSLKTKWKPGIKNGKPVRTAYNLPITVQVH